MEAPLTQVHPVIYYGHSPPGVLLYRTKNPSAVEKIKYSYISEDGEALTSALNYIAKSELISVDCEGVALGRKGQLCMVQIATAYKVFLFDVLSLGKMLFTKGLKSILEAQSPIKVFYDCRGDSDILYHQYDVDMKGVLDVALTEVYFRWVNDLGVPRFLKGYKKSVETYLQIANPAFYVLKDKVSSLMTSTEATCWRERPLSLDMLEYAAYDVKYLRDLHFRLTAAMSRHNIKTLYSASAKFVKVKRDSQGTEDNKLPMSSVSPDLFG